LPRWIIVAATDGAVVLSGLSAHRPVKRYRLAGGAGLTGTDQERRHESVLAAVRPGHRPQRLADRVGSPSPWCATGTMNGSGASITYRRIPRAIRFSVFSARARFRSKIDGQGSTHSMHSAAVRYGFSPGPCVGFGQTMGSPSERAITKRRRRLVGAP
jgi:hypothetical protein